MSIDRTQFPESTQLHGMSAQAGAWLLSQIDANDMTTFEALFVVQNMLDIVVRLMAKEMNRRRKKR